MTTETKITWQSGPSQAPLPPLVKGLPLLGSAREMYTDVLGFLVRQYQRMGPVFRVKVLQDIYTVIAGREANLFMTREGSKHFRSKEFWIGMDRELGVEKSLISSDGEEHARLRQLQKSGYGKSVIEDRLDQVADLARQAVADWPLGESRPVYPFLQDLVTTQLGTLIAGRAPGEYTRDVVNFVRTALLVKVTRQRPAILAMTPAYRRAKQRAFELGGQILDWHRAHPPLDREPNLIDDALAAARSGEILSEGDLMPVALGPYIAGLDTAASTGAFLMYALFKHPEIQAAVQAEAAALLEGDRPTKEKLKEQDVLHRALLETLRRYPIAPALQRTVTAPFEFGGCRIEAGGHILIGTTVAHFLPELHPDPLRFDIDRYLPPRNEHRTPGAFAPFGLGAHTCLGAGLAETLLMVTSAALLHYGRFEMDHPQDELKMRTAPTPAPDEHFRMRLVGRR